MPVVFIEDATQWRIYTADISILIMAADVVSDHLSKAIVRALRSAVFNEVRQRLWHETEEEFYRQIACSRDYVVRAEDNLDVRKEWHAYLLKISRKIFNEMSQADMIGDVNAERIAKAYNGLMKNLKGKKLMTDILGLPKQ